MSLYYCATALCSHDHYCHGFLKFCAVAVAVLVCEGVPPAALVVEKNVHSSISIPSSSRSRGESGLRQVATKQPALKSIIREYIYYTKLLCYYILTIS